MTPSQPNSGDTLPPFPLNRNGHSLSRIAVGEIRRALYGSHPGMLRLDVDGIRPQIPSC